MSADIVVEVEINNHEDHEEDKKLISHSVVLSGGSFIVRGGGSEVLASLRSTRRFVTSNVYFSSKHVQIKN